MLPAAYPHCSGPDLLWKRPSRGEQGGEEGTNLLFHRAEAQQGPHERFSKHGVTSWSPGDAEGPGEVSALTRADGSIWSSTGSSDYSGDATAPSSPSPACCVSCQQGTVTLGSPPWHASSPGTGTNPHWGIKEPGRDLSELQTAPKGHPAPAPRPSKASSRPPDGQANGETAFWQAL